MIKYPGTGISLAL